MCVVWAMKDVQVAKCAGLKSWQSGNSAIVEQKELLALLLQQRFRGDVSGNEERGEKCVKVKTLY
jgi:hypothetical protein